MSRFVRQSKVRHVYGEVAHHDKQWTNASLSPLAGDQQHIKTNGYYIAVPLSNQRGSVTIIESSKPSKLNHVLPLIDGHRGKTIEFEFCPFDVSTLLTGGDDCLIKAWRIPDNGLKDSIRESEVDIEGHEKKITVLKMCPTVKGVVASGSADHSVRVWDVENATQKYFFECNDAIQDICWNYDSSLLAVCSKDKQLRTIDPRHHGVVSHVQAHEGSKPAKALFLGNNPTIATVGFSKNSTRSFKLWDTRKLENPIVTNKIDQAAGTLLPFFDEGSQLLYIAGKGDGNIRYFEITSANPFFYKINEFRASKPTKGICQVPKRCLNVMKHEISKFIRLTSDSIEPVSFFCPRKAEHFLPELYPDCRSLVATTDCDTFFNSKEGYPPVLKSLDPANPESVHGDNNLISPNLNGNPIKRSLSKKDLESQLAIAKKYIEELQIKLDSNGASYPDMPNALK